MNIFSETRFLEVFGQIYFPGRALQPMVFQLDGKSWQLPSIAGKAIPRNDFIDFFEPLTDSPVNAQLTRYIERMSQSIVPVDDWTAQHLAQEFDPSPTIFWRDFPTWDAFMTHARRQESRIFSDARRRYRKLESEVGPIRWEMDDRRSTTLEQGCQWKSVQLQQQGEPDLFADADNRRFMRAMAAAGLLTVSSLTAGEELVAVHVGMIHDDRCYSWMTTYNANYAKYAPGRLLLHSLLEASWQQGHREFDFLQGGEAYKFHYATHVRLVTDCGARPLKTQLKHKIRSTLAPFPRVTQMAKHYRRKLKNSPLLRSH